jgi:RNA-binding protein
MHTDVIDKRMKPVGRVVDVFGNVSAPCAAILCRAEARADAGEMLFIK